MFRRIALKRSNTIPNSFRDRKIKTVYSYFLGNDSLTLQAVKCLHSMSYLPIQTIRVAHQHPGWVIKVKMSSPLTPQEDGDFRAFMNELGISYEKKLACSWYIYTSWTWNTPKSTLGMPVKLLWLFITVRSQARLKRFVSRLK